MLQKLEAVYEKYYMYLDHDDKYETKNLYLEIPVESFTFKTEPTTALFNEQFFD